MKTQHQHKLLAFRKAIFNSKDIVSQAKNPTNVLALEDISFDTHWNYSYLMDYIWSHKKTKKRKS